MLRLLSFVLLLGRSFGSGSGSGSGADDPMLQAVLRGGARPAALCAARGEAGCAGALWARYWLLTRASCAARAGTNRVPVLLDYPPDQCRHITFEAHNGIESLVQFVHPSYAPPAVDEWEEPEPDPLDAALVLLSAPAPPTRADNHTATSDLLPELSSWLRYVPAQVPWTRAPSGLSASPSPSPAPGPGPGPVPLLTTALGMLLATIVAPVVALLATFLLLLRWPQDKAEEQSTDEKKLVESDALCGEMA